MTAQTPLDDRSPPRLGGLRLSLTRRRCSAFAGRRLWSPLAVACLAALLLLFVAGQPARAATGLGQLSDPFVIAAPQADGLTLTESAGVQTLVFDPAQPPDKVSSYFAEADTESVAFDVQGKEQQFTAVQWSYSAPGDRGGWNVFVRYSLDGINWFNAGSGQTPNDQADVALQTIDLVAHGHRIQFRVRFTLNTPGAQASPPPLVTLPAPVTLWDIRVWHRGYTPPKKDAAKKPQKKPSQSDANNQQTALTTGGSGSGSGNGYGQGGGSGNGSGSGSGTGSASASRGQTTKATGPDASAVTAPASTPSDGGTWVNGFRVASLQAPAETVASSSGGSGGSAATASAAPAGPSLFVLLGLIALAALLAPGPIVARRLHRVASFDHARSTTGAVMRS
jgi:hypothetical protein